jgi:hypothetical protein
VSAVYLGSARPRLVAAAYLAGAIIMSLVMGLVVIAILRNTGLQHHSQRTPRYGLRLGLGLLMLAAGAVLARRKPKQPDPDNAKHGLVSRMIANPAPRSAFTVACCCPRVATPAGGRPDRSHHRHRRPRERLTTSARIIRCG